MSDCREIEQLLTPYVDGEAPHTDCAAVDAHLRACPRCREHVSNERAMREAVASCREKLRACASEDLRRRCQAGRPVVAVASAALTTPASVFQRRTWVPLSMAATLALAVAAVFLVGLRDGSEALAAQLATDHIRCFEAAPNPVILPDAKAIAREWATARGWMIKVPDSTRVEDLELLGVRRCISASGHTAHLMYKWHGQPLSVYVLNEQDPHVGDGPRVIEHLGQEEIMWSKGGRTYAVVARGRPSEIEHVAQYVRAWAE
jgi:anti-sigma factor RsiW